MEVECRQFLNRATAATSSLTPSTRRGGRLMFTSTPTLPTVKVERRIAAARRWATAVNQANHVTVWLAHRPSPLPAGHSWRSAHPSSRSRSLRLARAYLRHAVERRPRTWLQCSEKRRVVKEWVITCRLRWFPFH